MKQFLFLTLNDVDWTPLVLDPPFDGGDPEGKKTKEDEDVQQVDWRWRVVRGGGPFRM